jgi:sugar diacid utilization regulator
MREAPTVPLSPFADVLIRRPAGVAIVAEAIADDLPEVMRTIADAVWASVESMPQDLRATTSAMCHASTTLAVNMLRHGHDATGVPVSAAAEIQAREFVRRGLAVDSLMTLHRAWHFAFVQAWLARVHANLHDVDVVMATSTYSSAWLFKFAEASAMHTTAVYAAEKESWTRSAAARRQQDVTDILGGQIVDVGRASQRLRYALDRSHTAFVVWFSQTGSADTAKLTELAQTISGSLGSPALLCVPGGPYVVHAWVTIPEDMDPVAETEPLIRQLRAAGAGVAFGERGFGVDGFRTSHEQALETHRVALLGRRPSGTRMRFDEVSMIALMTTDVAKAQEFIDAMLGPLAADTDAAHRLVVTLRIFLELGESHVATGRRLGIHVNTARYRVRRAETLLGRSVHEDALRLHLALVLHETLHLPVSARPA